MTLRGLGWQTHWMDINGRVVSRIIFQHLFTSKILGASRLNLTANAIKPKKIWILPWNKKSARRTMALYVSSILKVLTLTVMFSKETVWYTFKNTDSNFWVNHHGKQEIEWIWVTKSDMAFSIHSLIQITLHFICFIYNSMHFRELPRYGLENIFEINMLQTNQISLYSSTVLICTSNESFHYIYVFVVLHIWTRFNRYIFYYLDFVEILKK